MSFGEFFTLGATCVAYSIMGVVLGMLANKLAAAFIKNDYSATGKIWMTMFAQLISASIILAFIQTWIAPTFAVKWQTTTAGIFFVYGFFMVQTHLHRTISAITE